MNFILLSKKSKTPPCIVLAQLKKQNVEINICSVRVEYYNVTKLKDKKGGKTMASVRVSKKERHCGDEPPDDGRDEEMVEERRHQPFSFKDEVLNTGSAFPCTESDWEADDLELVANDVKKVMVDGVITINFLEQVYNLIDESMSRTLVVKLLG